MSTYEVTVAQLQPFVEKEPCPPSGPEAELYRWSCDEGKHVDVFRETIFRVRVPASESKCIVTRYSVTERLHTRWPCNEEVTAALSEGVQSVAIAWGTLWQSDPPPSTEQKEHWDEPTVPTVICGDAGAPDSPCSERSRVETDYRKTCRGGVWSVTRIVTIVEVVPLGPKCHITRFTCRETLNTGIPCEELDFVDNSDAAALWIGAAAKKFPPLPELVPIPPGG